MLNALIVALITGYVLRRLFGPSLLQREEDLPREIEFQGGPFRDSPEARIFRLEAENRELEARLAESEARINALEEFWLQGGNGREARHPRRTQVVTGLCLGVAALIVAIGLSSVPSEDASSLTRPRLRLYPTMRAPSFEATSGGEVLEIDLRQIVVDIIRFEPWPEWCQEYELIILGTFYEVEGFYISTQTQVTWYLLVYAADPNPPHPRL